MFRQICLNVYSLTVKEALILIPRMGLSYLAVFYILQDNVMFNYVVRVCSLPSLGELRNTDKMKFHQLSNANTTTLNF